MYSFGYRILEIFIWNKLIHSENFQQISFCFFEKSTIFKYLESEKKTLSWIISWIKYFYLGFMLVWDTNDWIFRVI